MSFVFNNWRVEESVSDIGLIKIAILMVLNAVLIVMCICYVKKFIVLVAVLNYGLKENLRLEIKNKKKRNWDFLLNVD